MRTGKGEKKDGFEGGQIGNKVKCLKEKIKVYGGFPHILPHPSQSNQSLKNIRM